MKVTIDHVRCAGTGMCESFAPEVFEVQADGSLVLLTDEPPEGMSRAVRAAAESCPVEAITVEE
jgi:ferredoxin